MADKVEIVGQEKIDAFFRELERKAKPLAVAWVHMMKGAISPYPPPVGDQEKAHYQRGFGFVWPVRDDAVRAEDASNGVVSVRPGWHGKQTSERLGASWAFDESKADVAIVGNTASYAPDVHHAETQVPAHGSHGWKTDEQAYEATLPRFRQFCIDTCMATARAAGATSTTGGA